MQITIDAPERDPYLGSCRVTIEAGVSLDVEAICTVQGEWKNKQCGCPASHHMTDGKYHVMVCGNHVKSLVGRGWKVIDHE